VRAVRDSTKFNYGARLRAPKKMTTQGGRVTTLRATPIRFPAGREPAPGGEPGAGRPGDRCGLEHPVGGERDTGHRVVHADRDGSGHAGTVAALR